MESWQERFAQVALDRCSDTAHDLKTPLNIAVLNLELLRMRLRRLAVEEDEKIAGYSRAIDVEIRRLSRIFDAYFVLAYPPKDAQPPTSVAVDPIFEEAIEDADGSFEEGTTMSAVSCHEPRMRELARLFALGATSTIGKPVIFNRSFNGSTYTVRASGDLADPATEVLKLFKLYYSAPDGTPDLSLASARLIAETYGGELNADQRDGTLELKLSLPVG